MFGEGAHTERLAHGPVCHFTSHICTYVSAARQVRFSRYFYTEGAVFMYQGGLDWFQVKALM